MKHLLAALAVLLACQRPAPPQPTPAVLGKPPILKEGDLGQLQLSAEAAERLDIPQHLQPLKQAPLSHYASYAGELLSPPGQALLLLAPMQGSVLPPPGTTALPRAGAEVSPGQVLLALLPLNTPAERVHITAALSDAQALVTQAQAQQELATLALRRSERLRAEEAIGERQLEEARAQQASAEAALQAAQRRRNGLQGTAGALPGALSSQRVLAPFAGKLRDVRVAPGQQVPAGAPLLELVADYTLWLRVPVWPEELAELDPTAPAQLGELPLRPGRPLQPALPLPNAPLTTLGPPGTVDRYFAIGNQGGLFRSGQRVGVWLSQRTSAEAWVVPQAAVLYDSQGGTWIYEQTEASPKAHRYTRRRVELGPAVGGLYALSAHSLGGPSGLRPGALLVTAGAAELWGCEFGVGR